MMSPPPASSSFDCYHDTQSSASSTPRIFGNDGNESIVDGLSTLRWDKKNILAIVSVLSLLAFPLMQNFLARFYLREQQESVEKSPSALFYPSDQPYAFFRRSATAKQITSSTFKDRTVLRNTLVNTKPDQFITCNAPKTGCTAWSYFWEFANTGKRWNSSVIEHNPGLIHGHHGKVAKENGGVIPIWHYNLSVSEIMTMLTNLEMVAVGRNPYVRFLSSYSDWLGRAKKTEMQVSFGKFADEFLKLKKNSTSTKLFVSTPTNHIDTVSKFCQIGMYNYTLLRVEEQALWFNQFLKEYHLKEKMDEYTKYGNLVFSSGISEDSSIKDFTAQIAGRDSWPSELFKSSHHRGSSEKLSQYYTPVIAKVVTEIVFDDLMNFGYPLWDGVADNFHLI